MAVIPAAGMGTRMLPLTRAVPKELLPIGNLPMLHYAICEALSAGVTDVFVIINKERKPAIEHFYQRIGQESDGTTLPFGITMPMLQQSNLVFLHQPRALGIVDAVAKSKKYIGQAPFFLLMPDNILWGEQSACSQLQVAFREYGLSVLGLVEVTPATAPLFSNSGHVTLKEIREDVFYVIALQDKSRESFQLAGQQTVLRSCGRTILTAEFFDLAQRFSQDELSRKDEVPILQALEQGKRLLGKRLHGDLFDCGNWRGYWAANKFWMQKQQLWS